MLLRSHPGFEGPVNVRLSVNHENEGMGRSTSECQSSPSGEEYQAWYHAWHCSPCGHPRVPNKTACSALLLDGATDGSSREKKWGGEFPRHFLLHLAALNSCYCHKCHPGQLSTSWAMLHRMLYGTGIQSAWVINKPVVIWAACCGAGYQNCCHGVILPRLGDQSLSSYRQAFQANPSPKQLSGTSLCHNQITGGCLWNNEYITSFPSVTIFDKAATKGSGTVLMSVNAKSLESPRKPRATVLTAPFFTYLVKLSQACCPSNEYFSRENTHTKVLLKWL